MRSPISGLISFRLGSANVYVQVCVISRAMALSSALCPPDYACHGTFGILHSLGAAFSAVSALEALLLAAFCRSADATAENVCNDEVSLSFFSEPRRGRGGLFSKAITRFHPFPRRRVTRRAQSPSSLPRFKFRRAEHAAVCQDSARAAFFSMIECSS